MDELKLETQIDKLKEHLPPRAHQALAESLKISPDLEKEVQHGAQEYGHHAVVAEFAAREAKRLQTSFEVWLAKKEIEIFAESEKKPTVKEVEAQVKLDPSWEEQKTAISDAERNSKILKQVANAFEMKVNLVQTMCANRRKEIG